MQNIVWHKVELRRSSFVSYPFKGLKFTWKATAASMSFGDHFAKTRWVTKSHGLCKKAVAFPWQLQGNLKHVWPNADRPLNSWGVAHAICRKYLACCGTVSSPPPAVKAWKDFNWTSDIGCRGPSADSATRKTAPALVSGMMGGTFARLAWFFKPLVAVSIFEKNCTRKSCLASANAWARIEQGPRTFCVDIQMTGPFIAFHILLGYGFEVCRQPNPFGPRSCKPCNSQNLWKLLSLALRSCQKGVVSQNNDENYFSVSPTPPFTAQCLNRARAWWYNAFAVSNRNLSSAVGPGRPVGEFIRSKWRRTSVSICLALPQVPQAGAKCTQRTKPESSQWYNWGSRTIKNEDCSTRTFLGDFVQRYRIRIVRAVFLCHSAQLATQHSVAVPEKTSIKKHSLRHLLAQPILKLISWALWVRLQVVQRIDANHADSARCPWLRCCILWIYQ